MPPSEGLQLLQQFCDTGAWPESETDTELLAKEVLYFQLVDVFAQVKNKGMEVATRDKLALPLVVQLVHVCFLSDFDLPHIHCIQSHPSLDHWPNLIYSLTTILEQHKSEDMCLDPSVMGAGDLQLFHCFQNMHVTAKHLHKNNFFHNFACGGFHLCWLLEVSSILEKDWTNILLRKSSLA